MRRALTATALLVLVAGCATGVTGDAPPEAPGDPRAGASLYADNCARCHGEDLRGTDQGPPFLDDVYEPGHHGDGAFLVAVQRGVTPHHWDFGPMPPIPDVTPSQVTDIVAFVREQQRAAGID